MSWGIKELDPIGYANIKGRIIPLNEDSYKSFEKVWGVPFPEED